MGFFKSLASLPAVKPPAPTLKPQAVSRPTVIEGWSESELVAVYNAAPVRHLRRGEPLFAEAPQTDSFFVLLEGGIEVIVKWNGYPGRPGIFCRGDCIAPLPSAQGLLYCATAIDSSTVIELTPTVMSHLPDKTQLAVFRFAVGSTSKINAYIRSVNGEINSKNGLLGDYIVKRMAELSTSTESQFVQNFLKNIPRMPTYVGDLAVKLLDDGVSVKEVVEEIKCDPSIATTILKVVNSAQYSFQKKIESFYHACMILGFNNIYNLIIRDAVQSAMPVTAETRRIHDHSFLQSILCYEIASAVKEAPAQTASTIGLLHDIGKGVKILMKVAEPPKADYVDSLPAAKLGANLLTLWGLPERICKVVELQEQPEFKPPDSIPLEYRREVTTLHIAHILEGLLTGDPIEPTYTIYAQEHMRALGFSYSRPVELLHERVMPSLMRNKLRLPEEIQNLIMKAAEKK